MYVRRTSVDTTGSGRPLQPEVLLADANLYGRMVMFESEDGEGG